MGQLLEDTKLLIKTDTRIWAGIGFVLIVLVVWSLTDSWRPLPEVPEERYATIMEEEPKPIAPLLEGITESINEVSSNNNTLEADLSRVSRNIESRNEEIHWQMDSLVSRLGKMTDTIDNITKKVGEKNLDASIREIKMEKKLSKKR